jgi:hypothetical protein
MIPRGATVYVTSETFGVTVPLKTNLDEPAGLYLDRVVAALKLPTMLDHQGRVGVRFSYRLLNGDASLDRAVSLRAQNVKDKAVLWLESTLTPYSVGTPLRGVPQPPTFRGGESGQKNEEEQMVEDRACRAYKSAVISAGLGPA